jgi:glycosyltransferase involved in cell wall biosynthesis
MNVVFINTSDNSGGAAIACVRLQKALEKHTSIQGDILVQEQKTENPAVTSIANTSFKKQLVWGRFIAERLLFLPYERSKEIRFLFNRGMVGVDISLHPLVQNADIIHLHWINFGFLSTASIKKLLALGKPVVWTFHDMWPFTGGCHHSGECENYQIECGNCKFLKNPSDKDISRKDWKAKNSTYQPNHFTAVGCSKWLSKRAKNSSLLADFRIESIPNPIDTSIFSPISKTEARQKLNLPADKHLILFAAMRVNAPMKGFSYFQDALNLLKVNHPELSQNIELLVFGQADDEALAKLPFKTHKLGHLSDINQIVRAYNAASVFVTPSLEENLPNTIMESFACGTPAVGFSIGGIPEMIDHQQNGYLSEYRSVDSLATGIQWVLENNTEGKLSEKAREKVRSSYAEDVVAKQYSQLYKSLL